MKTSQSTIYSTVACNLDQHLLQATLPLFVSEKIEAIEWSFDTLFKVKNIPDWFVELLKTYSQANRLIGHGVYFSIFSGKWSEEQTNWLRHLNKTASHFKFDHVTEHFGFMTGSDFHKGAPISVPYNQSTLALGRDRLARIYDACQCPVGLENIAFAYTLDEVKQQGEFLTKLIEPINGFIILDLHNLYCQLQNFSLSFDTLIQAYPLDRVREIHISGGSWEPSEVQPTRNIRRDTHDNAVPDEVFELLKLSLNRCPNLKFVVLEQLGTALYTTAQQIQFQHDFDRMQNIIHQFLKKNTPQICNTFLPEINPLLSLEIPQNEQLAQQQAELSFILETAKNQSDAHEKLRLSSLANTDWKIENWSAYMLETALKIAQKWKQGW
jgi:uncharacterized protein (UPF0276 family)